jgi:hypothetical protein
VAQARGGAPRTARPLSALSSRVRACSPFPPAGNATRRGGYTGFVTAATIADAWSVPLSAQNRPLFTMPICCAAPRLRNAATTTRAKGDFLEVRQRS